MTISLNRFSPTYILSYEGTAGDSLASGMAGGGEGDSIVTTDGIQLYTSTVTPHVTRPLQRTKQERNKTNQNIKHSILQIY